MQADGGLIYRSPRKFEVLDGGVGHRGLLLRSNPTPEHASRIEVWFKPAYALCAAASLDGLEIYGPSAATYAASVLDRDLETWERVFEIVSGEGRGWVVAGGVHGREDNLAYDAPRMCDGWALKEGERPLFSVTST